MRKRAQRAGRAPEGAEWNSGDGRCQRELGGLQREVGRPQRELGEPQSGGEGLRGIWEGLRERGASKPVERVWRERNKVAIPHIWWYHISSSPTTRIRGHCPNREKKKERNWWKRDGRNFVKRENLTEEKKEANNKSQKESEQKRNLRDIIGGFGKKKAIKAVTIKNRHQVV